MRQMSRRTALAGGFWLLAPVAAFAQTGERFRAFLDALWPRARAAGVSRATFDAELANLTPDPALLGASARQPEFERPISAYIADATANGRVSRGREMRAAWASQLARLEQSEGVPAELILALWGMETDFGRASAGDHDVVRSLATTAFARNDDLLADEVVAALRMIETGVATRATLKGSWAGAMGQPQFLPSAYLKYAVAFSGKSAPNIWTSVPDTLASIGRFMREQGWKRGLPWGAETIVPTSFEWRSLKNPFATFAKQGFRRADGAALPASGDATLYLPAGAGGPAFLLSDNYWLIKQYNNSDSYAMSAALLGDRIAGGAGLRAAWPAGARLLPLADRVRLQTLLRDRGLYDGKIDGKFGPLARDAIHRFQIASGLQPADGFASARVLDALKRAP